MAILLACCACGPTYKTVEVTEAPATRPVEERKPEMPEEQKTDELVGYRAVEWKSLRGLDVKSGKATAELAALAGGNVKIRGYMVPFDDDAEQVGEFLLVPVSGMCIHTPPPPPNQIILVEVAGGANRVDMSKEVAVYGQFQLADGNSPYGKTGFKIAAVRAKAE